VDERPDLASNSPAIAIATDELLRLAELAQQARADLDLLRLEAATSRGAPGDGALLEANEQLVLALLGAQAELAMAGRSGSDGRRAADRDALTGLPDRNLLLDQFVLAIAAARRRGGRLALLFIDLDGFKSINDTLGHAVGDVALRHAAECLQGAVRKGDVVSRYGGDEFVVLLTDVVEPADAVLAAAKMLACFATPANIDDHVVRLDASIGISLFPDDGSDPEQLIQLADAAMYQAKRQASARVVMHGPRQAAEVLQHAPIALHNIKRLDTELAGQDLRQAQLQQANEQLLLAVLGAQELQTAAERARGDQNAFLAVVAHELRNPLTPIRSAAQLISRVDPAELPRLQAVIERQVDHVARLVGDLLDLSRFHLGKLRLQLRLVDVCTLVPECLDACRPAMDARMQSLRVQACEGGLFVNGDPVRLVQVLCNLLDNASKYTPDNGAIELTLKRAGANLAVVVADNGIGIRARVLPEVFHPFVQDSHATDFHSAGLGIGLTVVRELVEAHGGTVEAFSDGAGLGSRFVVSLPLVEPDATCSVDEGLAGARGR
jgi:diguanylate cyclase (GGDEF)-like protein